jgi:superkiller protein 3
MFEMKFAHIISLLTLQLASACLSSKPDTPELRNQQASLELARQMVGQGEYQRAVQFLLPRSRSENAPLEVHMLLGLSLLGLNNPSTAMKSFKTVLAADPSNDDASLNLGYTHILLGDYNESRKLFAEIQKRKKYAYPERVHLNIGLSYLQEKRCDRAMPEFMAALDADPTYSAPYFNMGKCHFKAGRLEDARTSFQRAVDFCPGCLEPQMELASVVYKLGDKTKAMNQIDSILKAKPDAALQKRALALRKQMTR